MPSGTWGNYSQEETITKFRGMMELLMEKRCRPMMKMEATVPPARWRGGAPGVEAPREEDAGVASLVAAAALGGGSPLPPLLPWRWCWCR